MDDSGEPPENVKFSLPEFKCSQCDYKTKGPKKYELHLKAHEFKTPIFACPSCHNLFKYRGNLQTHREKHCKEIKRSRAQKNVKTSKNQAPSLVRQFTFSGSDTAEQSLFDMLNSSKIPQSLQKSNAPIPEKDEDEIWIQNLKETLQQPLVTSSASVVRATTPVAQPASLSELFKNASPPPMSEEITDLNNICIQNLMGSNSLQSLGLLNASPTPQPVTLLDLFNSTTVPQSSKKPRCDVPSPKIDEYESYIQSLKNLKTLQQPFEFFNTTPGHQASVPVLPPIGKNVLEKATIHSPMKKKHSWECVDCGVGFMDEALYIVHRLTHVDNNPFKCALCGKQFFDRYSFTSHIYLQGHEEIKF